MSAGSKGLKIVAQAKINLQLRVLGREDTGYHFIETVFHRIDLHDIVALELTARDRVLDVEGADTGPVEQNLAFRAAQAHCAATEWRGGFRIELLKNIPVGGGLGGGSADAAAVLRGLNSLSSSPLDPASLLQLAASLGADVPFLASDAVMALAWGRGESFLALPPLPRRDLVLVFPGVPVSTADAYRWWDEDRARGQPAGAASFSRALSVEELGDWAAIARLARNDLESAVAARHPVIGEALARMRESRSLLSLMSGSGSTVFGVLDSPPDYSRIPEKHQHLVHTSGTSIQVVHPIPMD